MERARVERYIKMFAKVYVMFAILVLFVNGFSRGIVFGVILAIFQSFIWVLITAIFLIPIDYSRTRKMPI